MCAQWADAALWLPAPSDLSDLERTLALRLAPHEEEERPIFSVKRVSQSVTGPHFGCVALLPQTAEHRQIRAGHRASRGYFGLGLMAVAESFEQGSAPSKRSGKSGTRPTHAHHTPVTPLQATRPVFAHPRRPTFGVAHSASSHPSPRPFPLLCVDAKPQSQLSELTSPTTTATTRAALQIASHTPTGPHTPTSLPGT